MLDAQAINGADFVLNQQLFANFDIVNATNFYD